MAEKNPTHCGGAIDLAIPADHRAFLCRSFTAARGGLLNDLAEHRDQLRDPDGSRREADAFGQLLTALDADVIVPDSDVRGALAGLAQVVDDGNEYGRVLCEHDALHALLDQLPAQRGEG